MGPEVNKTPSDSSCAGEHSIFVIRSRMGPPVRMGRNLIYARRCLGATTLALRRSCGKSLGFRVTMKSALPCSLQWQKGSSPGSGEISIDERSFISSARSRIRLMTRPIRFRRTPRRFKTSLYSSKISSVTSQMKLPLSAHFWRTSALGFRPGTKGSRKPAMPATNTLVSTTTRGPRRLPFGGNGDLRGASLSAVAAYRA